MADDMPSASGALPDPPPFEPARVLDETSAPHPPARRDTGTSKVTSEGDSERADTCRICRSEATPDEPLFYPCKCSGSIKFVHQECLMEWLGHSHKKHCELCKTPFRFTKLYDANMPQKLPWAVFVRRACYHIILTLGKTCRSVLVGAVWLVFIPWIIRWVWRWFFWIADAAWAREAFMDMMRNSSLPKDNQERNVEWLTNTIQHLFDTESLFNETGGPIAYTFANALARNLGLRSGNKTSSGSGFAWPQADPSILSSWSYLAALTPSAYWNRFVLDVFEGQTITCVVITGFILVFLIREWVVQQQPHVNVNLENLGNVQQQLREAAERVQADNERLRRQRELLEQTRRRLEELQNEPATYTANSAHTNEEGKGKTAEFFGWEELEQLIDHATEHLKKGGPSEHARFLACAIAVTKQIGAAGDAGLSLDEFTDKFYEKLAGYTDAERQEWEEVLLSEMEKMASVRKQYEQHAQSDSQTDERSGDADEQIESSSTASKRPPMPEREISSRATQIQRLLEEEEGVLNETQRARPGSVSPSSTNVEPPTDTPSVVSAPSTESWQPITPPTDSTAMHAYGEETAFDPMPITNAGPDAKINIKRSGKGKLKAVPEPKIEEKMLAFDELKKSLEAEVAKEMEEERKHASRSETNDTQDGDPDRPSHEDNPFHPDGAEPERRNSESFGNRVASVFREEFGLDEAEELENLRQRGLGPDGETAPIDAQLDERAPRQPGDPAPGLFERLTDWFWGDIQPENAQDAVPAPSEARIDADNAQQEAAFVPVQDGRPVFGNEAVPEPDQPHDPEVLAAAQQAGLDPEAIEDAEDLEGIFELIGLQGPIIGLFQTSAFCSLLVACTIMCAVILPYVGGKLVLNLIGSPFYFLVQMPLQVASFVADLIIDVTLLLSGWGVMLLAWAASFLLAAAQAWMPWLPGVQLAERISEYTTRIVAKPIYRLQALFTTAGPAEPFGLSWAFLGSSVHAHASLKTMEDEINAVLNYIGAAVTCIIETISSGSVSSALRQSLDALRQIHELPAAIFAGLQQYAQPLLDSLSGLSRGALTFSTPDVPMDPSLVYWNSTDRFLAILTGYAALAALAAVYVAMDTPITKSESGRKTEKMIRDTLRQAGGVLKVILIISIEMLVFPLYCGMLLDLAFLPLFQDATVAGRWEFAGRKPYTFCFVHWFVGTCYMFHFALFVGMCRKILRRGVLWFIRDPDDPTFHPVRDVLERNVATQLRKIAFSALVYGALVILCLGGVIWTIGRVFKGIFPIHWVSTEPVLEFPLDLLLYNFVTPLVIRLFKPSDAVNVMYALWLRRCARSLRLSHFLFDDRRKDEEGHVVRKSWASVVLMRTANPDAEILPENQESTESSEEAEVYFKRDGKYVLTPCNDQYRPPKPGEAFLHADDDDVYIADKDGKKNDHFAKIYVPPLFRLRIALFMVCLWMFSVFMGLCATLVPLVFGRQIFALFVPEDMRVNDIYAYSVGAYILGGALFLALKGQAMAVYLKNKAMEVHIRAWIEPVRRFVVLSLKCGYVYGFIGVMLPILFALMLQFYLILPLHTWLVSSASAALPQMQNATNGATAAMALLNQTAPLPPPEQLSITEHTIHILQDYALGLLYVRIATRLIIAAPASRAAEAFRRITAEGYLNPDVRLATRFFVLPVALLAAFLLLFPPLTIGVGLIATRAFAAGTWRLDADAETKLYRYSYPMAASCVVLVLGVNELGKATSRWRARIRDEVYLVGERLHNFGEKRPPAGSKSVVRREK